MLCKNNQNSAFVNFTFERDFFDDYEFRHEQMNNFSSTRNNNGYFTICTSVKTLLQILKGIKKEEGLEYFQMALSPEANRFIVKIVYQNEALVKLHELHYGEGTMYRIAQTEPNNCLYKWAAVPSLIMDSMVHFAFDELCITHLDASLSLRSVNIEMSGNAYLRSLTRR
jgi:hypothetical protein